jgi:hypothetical protein
VTWFADGERLNQRHTRIAHDDHEQRRDKYTRVLTGGFALEAVRLTEITRKFVQQDDSRFAAEKFSER